MKRANLIPSVLFGAILASIIITSPEAENLKLPGTTLPQVVEFSGSSIHSEKLRLQSVNPSSAPQEIFTPYSQNIDDYDVEPASSQASHTVYSIHAG